MSMVVSCGNRERRGAELDFRRIESIDDFHGRSALGAKPKIARTSRGDHWLGCCEPNRASEK
jgi:hypothetical protein